MSSTEKAPLAPRDVVPQHLINRIENEWQQMRLAGTRTPRFELRQPDTSRD